MSQSSKRRKLSNGEYEQSPPPANPPQDEPSAPPADQTKQDQRRSLFVRSLPASVTTELLTQHFSQSFPLKHATVVLDPATKLSRGFGFVTFTDAEDAQAALEEFDHSVLEGRKIRVEVAESRHREIAEDITGARKETRNLKAEELRSQRQKKLDENKPPKLIVRNLPWSIKTSEDLSKLFMSYGKVKHATIPPGKGGQQAGFGFVILRGRKNAEKALEGVNGREVDGRTLAVDWAVDKETWEKMQDEESKAQAEQQLQTPAPLGPAEEAGVPLDDTSSDGGSEETVDSKSDNSDEGGPSNEEEEIMNGAEVPDDELSETSDVSSTSSKPNENSTTVFIRNLPFTADDDSLKSHFKDHFGAVRYARVVYDRETERSRGTAFVCFFNESDAKECVTNAPKHESISSQIDNKVDRKRKDEAMKHSLLQSETADPSGRYTLEGRILQVTRALGKADADRRMKESSAKRDHDKRRLYLLSEGTVPKGSQLYNLLGKAEIDIRESSAKQRQRLVKANPNLGLSLTRLSIRNISRSVTSKDLKALAREAVVGFAKDVKEGKRQPLSKEEIRRGGDTDREAERERKQKGKGIVKQVKIVFESQNTGSKVGEGKGGRSRGYGFIEYYGHRNALMGLRWLNGHLIKVKGAEDERNKRLIVEFAIENAQVVQRRQDREFRTRTGGFNRGAEGGVMERKRKRDDADGRGNHERRGKTPRKANAARKDEKAAPTGEEKNKIAMRNRVIAEKRKKRKMRAGRG